MPEWIEIPTEKPNTTFIWKIWVSTLVVSVLLISSLIWITSPSLVWEKPNYHKWVANVAVTPNSRISTGVVRELDGHRNWWATFGAELRLRRVRVRERILLQVNDRVEVMHDEYWRMGGSVLRIWRYNWKETSED